MPTKIVLFISVSLVRLPSPGSLAKKQNKKNSTLTHAKKKKIMSVYAFSVYCTSLVQTLSHTSSCVIRYGRPQKNGGGSLKL